MSKALDGWQAVADGNHTLLVGDHLLDMICLFICRLTGPQVSVGVALRSVFQVVAADRGAPEAHSCHPVSNRPVLRAIPTKLVALGAIQWQARVMDPSEHRNSFVVPPRRPYLRNELHNKLPSLNDQVDNLTDWSHPLEFEEVADNLYAAFRTASNMAPGKSYTGCKEHPNGALDPEPPQGWGLCLLCNDRRRRGLPVSPPSGSRRRGGYPVPDPPYTLERLVRYMRDVNELAFSLELTSPMSDYAAVADRLHEAFCVARELARPRNVSGCDKHPGAPIDPDAPEGQGCIFCAGTERRKALEGKPAVLPQVRRGERRNLYRRFPRPTHDNP